MSATAQVTGIMHISIRIRQVVCKKNMTVYYLNVKIAFCENIFKVEANQRKRPPILFAFSRIYHKYMYFVYG